MNPRSEQHDGFASECKDGTRERKENSKFTTSIILWISAAVVFVILLTTFTIVLVVIRPNNSQGTQKSDNRTTKEYVHFTMERTDNRTTKQYVHSTTEMIDNRTTKQCVNSATNGTQVCYTKQCVQAASNLLTFMDPTRDPCDDFYKFACGTFVSRNEMILGVKLDGHFNQMRSRVYLQLKAMLEIPQKHNDSEAWNMVKKFYNSCMNIEKQTQLNGWIHVEKTRMEKLLGDRPVLVGNWTPPDSYSWEKQLVHLIQFGMVSILKIWVDKDPEKSTHNSIWIEMKPISAGFRHLTGIDNETALKDSQDLYSMTLAIAKVPYVKIDAKLKTIEEMKSDLPNVDWDTLFSIFPAKLNVSNNDKVTVKAWEYFKNTINVFYTSNKRTVQNYIFDSFDNYMNYLKSFSPASYTEEMRTNLWMRCLWHIQDFLPQIIGGQYVKIYVEKKQISEVEVMAQEILTTLTEKLEEARWLDNKTRAHAMKKVNQMIPIVGYSEQLHSTISSMQSYKNVEIKEDDFFHNTLKIARANVHQNLISLRKPIQREDYVFDTTKVNAKYSPTRNVMAFMAAVLQSPAFSNEVPLYLNYGWLGCTVGHEITHAFDSFGQMFNEHGNVENWWTDATKQNYLKKAGCFINQFNNIIDPISGQKLDGHQNLRENMADTGGMKLAYTTFMKLLTKDPNMPTLPGLGNYTPEQLFFLKFGNFYCQTYTPQERRQSIMTDAHSLHSYRVNYSLKNLREFGDAFNCPKTAKMRINERCEMW